MLRHGRRGVVFAAVVTGMRGDRKKKRAR